MKNFIKIKLRESLRYNYVIGSADNDTYQLSEEMRFNDGRFNKSGHNTIYMDDEAIVDFGVGEIGTVSVGDVIYDNSIYLKGGYNAASQGRGYGTIGIKFIFNKLPKIQNIILQCYDTACPFWKKLGAVQIVQKEMPGGKILRTLLITREEFDKKIGL